MNRNLIGRYIWLVDILSTYGALSRERINKLWLQSPYSEGNPLPERTFYHYRRGVEEIFNIEIRCNKEGEYHISEASLQSNKGITNWLLDSYAVNNALTDSADVATRIEIEEVPSAREFLPQVMKSLREPRKIKFTYAGFNRSRAERDIRFRPYFLKRFKQRWYMIGLKEKSGEIRTYALDRVKSMELLSETFEFPDREALAEQFSHIIGVTESKAPVRRVKLKTTRTQAKYFRALPLHSSQCEEEIADDYSIFTFRLKINYELVHELLSLGDAVEVLEPRELRVMVIEEMKKALARYMENN